MRYVIIFLLLISFKTYSQGPYVNSCLIGSTLYPSLDPRFINGFNNSPAVTLTSGYCDWTPKTGSTCYICTGGTFDRRGNCSGTLVGGIQGTFSMVPCPLDSRLVWLIGLTSIFGFLVIKRNILPI